MTFTRQEREDASVVSLDVAIGRLSVLRLLHGNIVGWLVTAIPPGLIVEGSLAEPERFGLWLGTTFEGVGIDGGRGRLALPDSVALSRLVPMAPMPRRHRASALRFAAERHSPLNVEQAYLDWVSYDVGGSPGMLLVAAWRDAVDGYAHAMRVAGLEPEVVEPRWAATARVLDGRDELVIDAWADEVQLTRWSSAGPRVAHGRSKLRGDPGTLGHLVRQVLTESDSPLPLMVAAGDLEEEAEFINARPASAALNGHRPSRPADLPVRHMLATLGLAMR